MKRKRLSALCPAIDKPSEFGAAWLQWWVKMQPSWREGESLIRNLPDDADWGMISHAGSNGPALVLMTLSWWIACTKEDEQLSVELSTAIGEVQWVLSQLVKAFGGATSESRVSSCKRSRESHNEEQVEGPDSKKYARHLFTKTRTTTIAD